MGTNGQIDEVAELRQELAELRAEVQRLGARAGESAAERSTKEPSSSQLGSGSRRGLLRGAAAVGAGVAVAGLASRPAAAANGDPILIGQGNTGSADTSLTSSSEEALVVTTTNTTDFSTGVAGNSTGVSGTVFGVLGKANSPNGRGVRGDGQIGVEGISDKAGGIGMIGFSFDSVGTGVRAATSAVTGSSVGLDASVAAPDAVGVQAANTSATGQGRAVVATSASKFGTAMTGRATNTESGAATIGVRGTAASDFGIGVDGRNDEPSGSTVGVRGTAISPDGQGVLGIAAAGIGVLGIAEESGGLGAQFRGPRAALFIQSGGTGPPAEGSDAHVAGELQADDDGTLWYCTVAGTPGTWQKMAGAGTSGSFHSVTPARVYDSRPGQAPLTVVKGKLTPGTNRVVDCTVNSSGVPADAKAVVVNLTAAGTTGRGFLAVYPDGVPAPSTSTLNYDAGLNIANTTTSGCGPGASIRVLCGGLTGADFIIDVVGYYV